MQAMSTDRDRMSELPEEVLLHILSLIPTRQALEMSILSKRWRHLWTRIPALIFDGFEFPGIGHERINAFHDFTENVLFLRREDQSIRKFHFNAGAVDGMRVRQWLIDVARHNNVEELVIDIIKIQEKRETELLHCLSSCGSLRVLKLDITCCYSLKLPNEMNLSGLKSLHLKCITSEGGSLGKLISSCHFLEDLYLRDCQFDSLIISGNNLKKLSILSCWESKIKVSVSSPLSFVYSPGFKTVCSLDNLVPLIKAHIKISTMVSSYSQCMITICEILQGFRYASSLTLDYCIIEQELVDCLPTFSNLTHLELNTWLNKGNVEVIINILERSPNLKTLILNKMWSFYPPMPEQEDTSWTPKEISPPFFLHLEKIVMRGFKSSALYLEFMKFLLRHTISVEKITIIP